MIRPTLLILLTASLVLGLAGTGCASRDRTAEDETRPDPWSFGPATDNQGHVRSLTFDTPEHRALVATQPWLAEVEASDMWYYDRNDRYPTVASGYQSPTIELSWTYTRDHQSVRDGRVHDHVSSTTYRSSSTRSVR